MSPSKMLRCLGLLAVLAASEASAAPTAFFSSVLDRDGLTWRQVRLTVSTPWVSEYELFDGDRSLGWARVTSRQPSAERYGAECPSLTMNYFFSNTTDRTLKFSFDAASPPLMTIPNASVRFTGDIKLTDNSNSGASLTGNGAGGAAYEAAVNGSVDAGGTTVSTQFTSTLNADDGEMVKDSFDTGCFFVGDVFQLAGRIAFDISAQSSATGTLRLEVCCHPVPLPTGGAMAAAGLLTLGAIRRRRD